MKHRATHLIRLHACLATLVLCVANEAHAEQLVDPTRPASARDIGKPVKSGEFSSLRVEAIFGDSASQRRRAIVDGKLVYEGDHVGPVLIEHISSDGVRYSRNGRTQMALLIPNKLQVRKAVPIQLAAREEQP